MIGYGYIRSAFRNIKRACPLPGRRKKAAPSGEPERILPVRLRSGRSRLSKMRASARRHTSSATLLVSLLVAVVLLFAFFWFVKV